MFEIFKTVLMLSCIGAGMTMLLLLLKPLTVRKFPAKWQYAIWFVVVVCMVIPLWKFIPQRDMQMMAPQEAVGQIAQSDNQENAAEIETVIIEQTPMEYREIPITASRSIRIYDLVAYLWFGGMGVFLLLAFGSYFLFLMRKKHGSIELTEYEVFEEVKKELHIRRHIRLRVSKAAASPMLVGTFFPVVYVPSNQLDKETERMIFRHELTHYKHGDLVFKWLTLLVNAVHWFNPFAYLLSANVSEACEVSCDMAVIKNLSEQEQKFYMNTILDLVEQETRRT